MPGPRSRAHVDVLARHECPAITARRARRAADLGAADDDPIVWAEALGVNVRDADDNVLVDLTAGFGVALLGHRHAAVIEAATAQSLRLVHAMGDAFPDETRIRLLADLAAAAPPGLSRSILGLSGSDAVDAAVKTAMLATGRDGVLTFRGGYHGLGMGPTGLQAYKESFAAPFRAVLHPRVRHADYGAPMSEITSILGDGTVGLVLVEPVQARGGCRAPPAGWLADLAALTRHHGALLAVDEIYSGLGRTGAPWAVDHEGVRPDLLCTGKALGGGFPLSACVGTDAAMDAWGASRGESLHTQTFLGHPVGCAAARVVLGRLAATSAQAATEGAALRRACERAGWRVRGVGLLLGIELGARSLAASRGLLARGWITLPAGIYGEVLSLTPPLGLTPELIARFVLDLQGVLGEA